MNTPTRSRFDESAELQPSCSATRIARPRLALSAIAFRVPIRLIENSVTALLMDAVDEQALAPTRRTEAIGQRWLTPESLDELIPPCRRVVGSVSRSRVRRFARAMDRGAWSATGCSRSRRSCRDR